MQILTKHTWRASPPLLAREERTVCNGMGWELLPISGFSRARRCPCSALSRMVNLKERARMPQRYEHCLLDSFLSGNSSQTRALIEARKFAFP